MPSPQPIIVVGHKNPDNDAISAAIGYAYLKNELAKRDAADGAEPQVYVPARLGPLPPETAGVLEKWGVQPPMVINNVFARVSDVMTPDVITIASDATLIEAGRILRKHNIQAVVVIDADGVYQGPGAPDEDRRNGFELDGATMFDDDWQVTQVRFVR